MGIIWGGEGGEEGAAPFFYAARQIKSRLQQRHKIVLALSRSYYDSLRRPRSLNTLSNHAW